jgi:hypothetical protein
MHLQLRSRAGSHARLIAGIVGAAVVLTGGGTLAATGQSRPQAATSGVTMDQAEAFVGVTPTRVLDTRQIGSTKFGPGETRTLSFGAHVPPEATSVALALVSPQGATALGYFTMWPSGQPRPETSVLNPVPSYDLATSALLRLGSGQGINIYNAFGQSDIVVDLLGYFVPLSDVEGLGGGSNFLVGSGAPASTLGEDGDVYYDSDGQTFYGPKENGDWGDGSSATGPAGPQGAVGPEGPAGADGSQFLSGAVAPTTQGVNGDFYLNTATGELYGPKAGGVWGSPTDLTGPAGADGADGSQILSGAGVPASGLGVDGDFYFDTASDTFYGPKTAGAWGAGTSVQGAQGPAGTMGPGTQVYGTGVGVIAILGLSAPIVFDEVPRTYGGGVGAYNAGNGELTLTAAGTYRVSYTAESTLGVLATVAVEVDGTAVPGSDSGGVLSASSFNGETLVTVTAGQVLRLAYSAALGVNATLDASMIVEKVG